MAAVASSAPLRGFLGIVLLLLFAHVANAQLSAGFYEKSCPGLQRIVRREMRKALDREARLGASILRLFFHDCFVLGCDASILLDGESSEKNARPNRNSARGFEVIDRIKTRVEKKCSGVVSCADILALAAREGVKLLGGPSFCLGLGRRDSLKSSLSDANSGQIPPANGPPSELDNLISRFNDKGLSATDLTALSGAHTIGQARCVHFLQRLTEDDNIDPRFAARRRKDCRSSEDDDNLAPLDPTPKNFDNRYFKKLLRQRGLLHSDQVLFNNATTDSLVRRYARSESAFFNDFSAAMTRMSNINPLTGSKGEIRKNCRVVN